VPGSIEIGSLDDSCPRPGSWSDGFKDWFGGAQRIPTGAGPCPQDWGRETLFPSIGPPTAGRSILREAHISGTSGTIARKRGRGHIFGWGPYTPAWIVSGCAVMRQQCQREGPPDRLFSVSV